MHNKLFHFKTVPKVKMSFEHDLWESQEKNGLSFFLDQIEKKLLCMHCEIIQKKPKRFILKKCIN
jgi:hypothetical protein